MLSINSDSDSIVPKDISHDAEKHSYKVLYVMNQHRKLNTKLCDTILQVNETIFPVHRSILSVCSPYFLAMFNGDMKESRERVIVLKDIRADILEIIIDYVYSGDIHLNSENVEAVLEHATCLQFCEVKQLCCDFLEKQIDSHNCIGIRKFAALHFCKTFLEKIDKYIIKNFMDVVLGEEFASLPLDVLKSIISSKTLNVDGEERVYESVLKWIKSDIEHRQCHLKELLECVKLPLVPVQYIMNNVDNEPLVKRSLSCRDLLDEAKNYLLQPENHAVMRSYRTIPRLSTTGLLFAIAGKQTGEVITDKCECFSIYEGKWAPIAPLTVNRQQLGVCELNGKIFAMAGSDGQNRLNSVEVYWEDTNCWKAATPLHNGRSGLVAASLGDAVYAIGGYDGNNCLTSVERFDPAVGTWHLTAPTNMGRSFPAAATLNGRIYVIGGNDGSTFLSTCECYDPLTNKWSYITPMNGSRAGIGCAVLDGKLYVAGGFDGMNRLELVEMYDPRSNAWTNITPMNAGRDGACIVSYAGYLFALGGIDGPSYLDTVEYYDPSTMKWYDSVPMITSRAASGLAVLENSFLIHNPSYEL